MYCGFVKAGVHLYKKRDMSQFIDILTEKCPKCGKGKVFENSGNVFLFKMPKMHDHCPNCGHGFHKETGYFFGAMYVSYAIAVAEMVAVFVIAQFFTESFGVMVGLIALMSILLSTFNYRFSRMLWIYMFDGPERSL